jgi:hypothetical protein
MQLHGYKFCLLIKKQACLTGEPWCAAALYSKLYCTTEAWDYGGMDLLLYK